jgi:type IV secretion system protein VirB5
MENKMKKIFIILLLITPLAVQNIGASGIPTIDIVSMIQGLKDALVQAKQFKDQISEARNRLNRLKETGKHYKDMVDGHFDWESLLNDPTLNKHLALGNWKKIYDGIGDINNLRDEFHMQSDDPRIQSKWDKQLKAYKVQRDFYYASVKRSENLKNLLKQFSTATNPAAKADLANSIQFENTQVENDAEMMKSMAALMEQKARFEHELSIAESRRKFSEEGIEIDYSSAYDFLDD